MKENHRIRGSASFRGGGYAASTGRIQCHLHGLTQHYSPSMRICTHSFRAATSSQSTGFSSQRRRPMLNLINRLILTCLLAGMVAGAGIKAESELRVGGVYMVKDRLRVKSMLSSHSPDRDFKIMIGATIELTGRDSSGVWVIRPLYPHAEDTGAYKLSPAEYFNPDLRYHVGSYEELFRAPGLQPAMLRDASPSKSQPLDGDFAYRLAVERLKYIIDRHNPKYFVRINIISCNIIATWGMYIVYLHFEGINQFADTTYFRNEQRVWHRRDVDLMQQTIPMSTVWNCGWWWDKEMFARASNGEWYKDWSYSDPGDP